MGTGGRRLIWCACGGESGVARWSFAACERRADVELAAVRHVWLQLWGEGAGGAQQQGELMKMQGKATSLYPIPRCDRSLNVEQMTVLEQDNELRVAVCPCRETRKNEASLLFAFAHAPLIWKT